MARTYLEHQWGKNLSVYFFSLPSDNPSHINVCLINFLPSFLTLAHRQAVLPAQEFKWRHPCQFEHSVVFCHFNCRLVPSLHSPRVFHITNGSQLPFCFSSLKSAGVCHSQIIVVLICQWYVVTCFFPLCISIHSCDLYCLVFNYVSLK